MLTMMLYMTNSDLCNTWINKIQCKRNALTTLLVILLSHFFRCFHSSQFFHKWKKNISYIRVLRSTIIQLLHLLYSFHFKNACAEQTEVPQCINRWPSPSYMHSNFIQIFFFFFFSFFFISSFYSSNRNSWYINENKKYFWRFIVQPKMWTVCFDFRIKCDLNWVRFYRFDPSSHRFLCFVLYFKAAAHFTLFLIQCSICCLYTFIINLNRLERHKQDESILCASKVN